jgi:hypothetical protein
LWPEPWAVLCSVPQAERSFNCIPQLMAVRPFVKKAARFALLRGRLPRDQWA